MAKKESKQKKMNVRVDFTPEDMPVVADCIDKIATDYEANREAVLAAVAELVRKYPIYE